MTKAKEPYGPPNGDYCPWCGKKLLVPWSGVKCPDEMNCGYWYCL